MSSSHGGLPARRRWLAALAVLGWGAAPAMLGLQAAAAQAQTQAPAKKPRAKAAAKPSARRRSRPAGPAYVGHPAAMAFAEEVATERGLSADWLRQQLGQARQLPAVQQLIMPPPVGVPKNWAAYRARFIEPQRINAGLAFWQQHARWLAEAEARWGVPPEIVAAIVGVETFYGRITGNFRLIDALATLSFDFPTGRRDRSAFFRSELAEFFVLCAREGRDPQSMKGSFAGAWGLPQFMPGSVNRWALDFDGDDHVDLMDSGADVVGSVAHFLAAHGWERGLPTHYAVTLPAEPANAAMLLAPDIRPSFTAAEFAAHGATLPKEAQGHEGLLALVELQNGEAPATHVAGTANFYVITRYNWSAYYAMAVIDLAAALRQGRGPG
ncbi:lytic murein transglycosylase B [Rubrivivax rivuli]|nr:lytic murein transglycosylase B [Rubrivivax rivuli]